MPLLHISAHGSQTGITFLNDDRVEWDEMRDAFRKINTSFVDGLLFVSMSSCHGVTAAEMAAEDGDYPFHALVGPEGEPTWAETAIGYATYYHQIAAGAPADDAVNAMRVASGFDGFTMVLAETVRKAAHLLRDQQVQAAILSARRAAHVRHVHRVQGDIDHARRKDEHVVRTVQQARRRSPIRRPR